MTERYFLRLGDEKTKEVSKEEYIQAERDCGYISLTPGKPATKIFRVYTPDENILAISGAIVDSDEDVNETIYLLDGFF